MNIQHSTINIQHPVPSHAKPFIGWSVLAVGRWLFLYPCFVSFSAFAQTNGLPMLVPAYAEIPPTFWERHQAIVIIGVLLAVALAALIAWKIFRPKPEPVLPPEQIARDALARLQAQPEDGKLLSDASQILRRYAGAVFDFPGGEMTTAEFCTSISQNQNIGTDLSGAISSFLRECDVRKFSPAGGTIPVNAVNRALEIVARIEKETHRQDACATTA